MRVLLSGGGTGGHVYPILAVVKELRAGDGKPKPEDGPSTQGPADARAEAVSHPLSPVELLYIGEAGGTEEDLARREGIPFSAIDTGQIRGRSIWVAASSILRMRRGAAECGAILRTFQPDVVFMTGGYVAAPVAWAAWRADVPILIYLPDVIPGQAIRWTSRLASRVAVSFPEAAHFFGGKAVVTGYPVRRELLTTDRNTARAALGLSGDLPVLVVMGGSRGARSINRALEGALPELLACCQVVHVSGTLDWPAVQKAVGRVSEGLIGRYHAYPYLHEMPQALAAADLAIARAGAATLGEFPAVGLASILVPYPYSGQHQDANAAFLAERGAALVIRDDALPAKLAQAVLGLLGSSERLAAMSKAAADLSRPDAAANIAVELRRLARPAKQKG